MLATIETTCFSTSPIFNLCRSEVNVLKSIKFFDQKIPRRLKLQLSNVPKPKDFTEELM